MKIAIVSPNKILLNEIGKLLQAASHVAVLSEGGKEKLRQVADQDRPDLMLVDGGSFCDGTSLAPIEDLTTRHPHVAVVLLCGGCSPDFLISAMRSGVREVLASPVVPADLAATVNRIGAKLRSTQAPSSGKVLAFLPCKGGSGATFLATSVGYQLAQTRSVLLIDLNLQFGDALSFVHEGRAPSNLADVARAVDRLDASFLAASTVRVAPSFSIMAAPDDHAQAVEITPAQVDAILSVAVLHYDFVLLDLGRAIDNLAIRALDRADMIYPVLQAGLPSIRNAKKMLAIFSSLDYGAGKIELVVNRYDRKGAIGVAEIERTLGKFAIHTVPNSYKHVTTAIEHGEPLAASAGSDPVLRNVAELADAISPRPHAPRSMFERLLGRAAASTSGEPHVVP